VGTITIGMGRTNNLAITQDGLHLYVTLFDMGAVAVIDTLSNSVVGPPISVGTNPVGVAITPCGDVYVTNFGTGTVSVIDSDTGTVVGPAITVGTQPTSVGITPNGKHAYVTNQGDGTVSAINVKTRAIDASITVGPGPSHVAISRN
jgi:YVTN family beta-propeller protein